VYVYLNPVLLCITRGPTLQSRSLRSLATIILPPRRRDTSYRAHLRPSVSRARCGSGLPNFSDDPNLSAPPLSPLLVVQPLFPTQLLACWPEAFHSFLSSFATADGFGFTIGAGQHAKIVGGDQITVILGPSTGPYNLVVSLSRRLSLLTGTPPLQRRGALMSIRRMSPL
jgi:hypothetical protein